MLHVVLLCDVYTVHVYVCQYYQYSVCVIIFLFFTGVIFHLTRDASQVVCTAWNYVTVVWVAQPQAVLFLSMKVSKVT